MKNKLLILIMLLLFVTPILSQSKLDCYKTCIVDKTVYQGAQLGVKLTPNCGDKGAYIAEVIVNSAANKSLLKTNDLLISVNNIEIKHPAHFKRILSKIKAFQEATIVYERKSKRYTTQIILDARVSNIIQEEVCCDTFSLEENIAIYPNPAVKNLQVRFKKSVQENYTFEVFNLNGVRFFNEENSKLNNNLTKSISVEDLEDGVYVLKIKQDSKVYSSLFVVKKQ